MDTSTENPSPASSATVSVLLLSDDLLFPSRVREGLRPLGYSLRVVGTQEAVQAAAASVPPPSVILVNLNARRYDPLAVIAGLKDTPATRTIPLLAFAGHVEKEKHAAARGAGADLVAANSSVAMHLPALLQRLLSGSVGNDVMEDEDEDESAG